MNKMMNIKSAKYEKAHLSNENGSIRLILTDDTSLSVPLVVGNRHYDAVVAWAKLNGNTIESAD